MNKEIRLETLKAAGLDVNSFFSISGLKPGDKISFTLGDNGTMKMEMEDKVVRDIIENGYVKNTKLHRRWIAAQTLRILYKVEHDCRYASYDEYVRKNYPFMYQFKFMENEVKVLAELEKADKESFEERAHFFNKRTVAQIYSEYFAKLNTISSAHIVRKENIDKLISKLYMKVCVGDFRNYSEMYYNIREINRNIVDISYYLNREECFSKTWIDTFKGEGAFYTLKNLLLFHGLKLVVNTRRSDYLSGWSREETYVGKKAFDYAASKLDGYEGEGWRFMAMLKKCLADNKFDVTMLY